MRCSGATAADLPIFCGRIFGARARSSCRQGSPSLPGEWTPQPPPPLIMGACLNLEPLGGDLATRGKLQEAVMTHWHDTMVDRPETDGAVYATGWTISGLAVLAVIFAAWVFAI